MKQTIKLKIMCTRIVYTDDNNKTITGRNMDWSNWLDARVWIYPRGIKRDGTIGKKPFKWTSFYKSITTAAKNTVTTDGMNEEGLVANLLWITDSEYPNTENKIHGAPISVTIWAQYILDNCEDVEEAIEAMNFVYIVTTNYPGSDTIMAKCNLAVSDRKGNSAIFEYINGVLTVSTNGRGNLNRNCILNNNYTQQEVSVLTNKPQFDKQLKKNDHWKLLNETNKLPGSSASIDRFIRASYYTQNIKGGNLKDTEALAGVLNVMHNVAQPMTMSEDLKNHNTDRTQYTTLSDQEKRIFYFYSTRSHSLVWIDLNEIYFSSDAGLINDAYTLSFEENGSSVKGYPLASGNAIDYLVPKKAFSFLQTEIQTLLMA